MSKSTLVNAFTHIVPKRRLDAVGLRKHLQDVDPALLLMSLVHVTRDLSLLERFGPAMALPEESFANEVCGNPEAAIVSKQVLDEMIDLAVGVLDSAPEDQAEYLSGYDLDDETFLSMARIATGQEIGPVYTRMFKEQTGFVRNMPELPQSGEHPTDRIELAIIGAGMSGLAAAVQAVDRGFNFRIFETNDKIGGVWALNSYPGVAVDTPSAYYSLSFELNPTWTNHYPNGAEYFDYLNRLVDKYDIRNRISFNSEVLKIRWVDEAQEWELTVVENGRTASKYRATAVMTAAGHLNRPLYPDLRGRETFKGASMHANRWNPDIELRGKRVGVIGTGSTAVQVIAKIAPETEHLTVFQRQPGWIKPNTVGDGVVTEGERWAREHLPYFLHWDRLKDYYSWSDITGYPTVRADPEWAKTHVSISPANDRAMQQYLAYIHKCFGEGSELARKVTPTYAPMGKRLVRDPADFGPGGYYYTLAQPHVDLETARLARVVPDGILTVDGKLIELDVIIYATGLTLDWLSPIEVIGRDGVKLSEAWRDNNPSSYLGGMVPNFPNLFVNSGPNTGASHAGGHNFMAEVVNHFVMECLQLLVEDDAKSLEVTREAFDEHNAMIDEKMAGSVWVWERGANTYYTNQKGRPILPTPIRHVELWELSRRPDRDCFIIR